MKKKHEYFLEVPAQKVNGTTFVDANFLIRLLDFSKELEKVSLLHLLKKK